MPTVPTGSATSNCHSCSGCRPLPPQIPPNQNVRRPGFHDVLVLRNEEEDIPVRLGEGPAVGLGGEAAPFADEGEGPGPELAFLVPVIHVAKDGEAFGRRLAAEAAI